MMQPQAQKKPINKPAKNLKPMASRDEDQKPNEIPPKVYARNKAKMNTDADESKRLELKSKAYRAERIRQS